MVNARVVVGLLAAAGVAGANDTVIEVPQGSGVFPTVGQVDCLEELGSGRFCAATYECADDSGELWGDLANHDGRRAIGVDSPVARERDCSITVDGQAAVRWFTGFSPDGRNGALVGVTAKHDAEPPVVRRVATGGSGGDGSFLSWYVERYEIEDVVAEVRHAACGHFEDGTSHEENCLKYDFPRMLGRVARTAAWENTPFTRCATELHVDLYEHLHGSKPVPLWTLTGSLDGGYYCTEVSQRNRLAQFRLCLTVATLTTRREHENTESNLPGRYAGCRTLLEEQWGREGFGELP